MTSRTFQSTFLLAACLLSAPAFAIYKCENNGTVSYTDQSCPGGTQVKTEPAAPNDSNAAKRRFTEDTKALKQLEKERHRREAEQEKKDRKLEQARAIRHKKCSSLALKTKWAEEEAASAQPKAAAKQKRKAQRAEEKYALECGT